MRQSLKALRLAEEGKTEEEVLAEIRKDLAEGRLMAALALSQQYHVHSDELCRVLQASAAAN